MRATIRPLGCSIVEELWGCLRERQEREGERWGVKEREGRSVRKREGELGWGCHWSSSPENAEENDHGEGHRA